MERVAGLDTDSKLGWERISQNQLSLSMTVPVLQLKIRDRKRKWERKLVDEKSVLTHARIDWKKSSFLPSSSSHSTSSTGAKLKKGVSPNEPEERTKRVWLAAKRMGERAELRLGRGTRTCASRASSRATQKGCENAKKELVHKALIDTKIGTYQLFTCKIVRPVSWASCFFWSSDGYGCCYLRGKICKVVIIGLKIEKVEIDEKGRNSRLNLLLDAGTAKLA